MLANNTYTQKMNDLAGRAIPFLFVIDFLGMEPIIIPLDELDDSIRFSIPGRPDSKATKIVVADRFSLRKEPVPYPSFKVAFDQIQKEIYHGNSFLVNLTQPTPIECSHDLEGIYHISQAPYKLFVKNRFVVFSPETFIRIEGQKITTFPMKGTIDASIPNAAAVILNDEKETAEHFTIVDLMRNDLSSIAKNIRVNRFRYLEEIKTHEKRILQVSSELTAELPEDFRDHLGDLLFKILPAGSISGAPKEKTLEIIRSAEGYDRGFYTGIFGIYDGYNLDSAVMIRFIEQTVDGLVFKSGGGITYRSQAEKEYQELIDKVYVPITGNNQNP